MKWKPVLCVAVLALAAGCAQQNPYSSFGEYGFSYDLEQAPVPGLTVAENERIDRTPTGNPIQLLNPPIVVPVQMQEPPVVEAPAAPMAPVVSPTDTSSPVAAPAPAPAPPQ